MVITILNTIGLIAVVFYTNKRMTAMEERLDRFASETEGVNRKLHESSGVALRMSQVHDDFKGFF